METAIACFLIGAIGTAAAFGAGLGAFITTKTLTKMAAKVSEQLEDRQAEIAGR